MKTDFLFDKLSELKDKFKSFFQHRKKISALENFSMGAAFPHRNYLRLLKECVKEGFLGMKESDFLDHMLTSYELNYLDWAHKTRWVKSQIQRRAIKMPAPQLQQFFNFEEKKTAVHVPVHLLNSIKNQPVRRV